MILELNFCWLELKTKSLVISVVVFEANRGLNGVFFLFVVHFGKNHVSRLLVNTNLSLNNHVVNQTNESPQMVVVELS